MTDPAWPDSGVVFEFPPVTHENTTLWATAVNDAVKAGRLRLETDEVDADFVTLSGDCPRCGHFTQQTLEFNVIVGFNKGLARQGLFNVICTCSEPHLGRPASRQGCGWGAANEVRLIHPGPGR